MGISGLALLLAVTAVGKEPEQPVRLDWKDNMLTVFSPALSGGTLEIWYLEAFCRSNSTDRDWAETVIPHNTTKLEAGVDGTTLKLKSVIEPGVVVMHDIRVGGMDPGETKQLRGKLYLMPNDPEKLLARYRRDFPSSPGGRSSR